MGEHRDVVDVGHSELFEPSKNPVNGSLEGGRAAPDSKRHNRELKVAKRLAEGTDLTRPIGELDLPVAFHGIKDRDEPRGP